MPKILIADCCSRAAQLDVAAHGARSNVAVFEAALRLHQPEVRCLSINLAEQESLPAGVAIRDFDGVMLTGSPLHVGDRTPEVCCQIDFARAVFESDAAVWGSCYGLQLAAVALGGTVRRNPKGREIGVARDITVTERGCAHPMLAGRPAIFHAVCSHLDEVGTPPPGASVLAENAVSAVQAIAAGTPGGGMFYGTQYHPELDLAVVAALFRLGTASLVAEGFARDEAAIHAMAVDFQTLSAAPDRQDLAWRYGISVEILDPRRRTLEIGNWLRSVVMTRRDR